MKVTIYGVGFQSTNGMAPGLVSAFRPGEKVETPWVVVDQK